MRVSSAIPDDELAAAMTTSGDTGARAGDDEAQGLGLGPAIRAAVAAGSVEGHLAVLVLTSGFAPGAVVESPWTAAAEVLRAHAGDPDPVLRTTTAVAVAGLRAALGAPAHADWPAAARRELARERMPPAACVRDDERLLLGVAAGVGAAAPEVARELARDLAAITGSRRHVATLRQACLDVWAEALAAGAPRLTREAADAAYTLLTSPSSRRPAQLDEDRLAAFWLATRLLSAPWSPTDEQLAALEAVLDAGRRAVIAQAYGGRTASALEAALLLDALSAAPAARLARRSALENVLAAIDHFAASAGVLRTRHDGRPGFEIADEYDVQDLFRALVLPFVPDLTPENPAPKVAGKSSRLDFTSRMTRLGFELKHVKHRRHAAAVREEVLVDERTYQEHPQVETVVVFIHDPGGFIPLGDRPAFEAELSTTVGVEGRTVRYVVRVR